MRTQKTDAVMFNDRMLLCDFHIHSNFSDGKHSIPEIVDFYGMRGFSCIAITDHLCETESFLGFGARILEKTLTPETFPLYLETIRAECERAERVYQMKVIPGVEITKNYLTNRRSSHFIGLGITKIPNANSPTECILRDLKREGALTIAAHPVSTNKLEIQTRHLWDQREALKDLFDAWEVGCGINYFHEVAQSGLPLIANTDLHRFSQITGWKSKIQSELHQDAIFEAIRNRRVEPYYYVEEQESVWKSGGKLDWFADKMTPQKENIDYVTSFGT